MKGLEKQKEWIVVRELGLENREPSHTWAEGGGTLQSGMEGPFPRTRRRLESWRRVTEGLIEQSVFSGRKMLLIVCTLAMALLLDA